jgi:tyrosyl-tRNA synthetase
MIKPAVSAALVDLMAPIQAAYQASKEWQDITLKAYPPPVAEKKQKKTKDKGTKDKGSRFPGNKVGDGAKSSDQQIEKTP